MYFNNFSASSAQLNSAKFQEALIVKLDDTNFFLCCKGTHILSIFLVINKCLLSWIAYLISVCPLTPESRHRTKTLSCVIHSPQL